MFRLALDCLEARLVELIPFVSVRLEPVQNGPLASSSASTCLWPQRALCGRFECACATCLAGCGQPSDCAARRQMARAAEAPSARIKLFAVAAF